MMEADVPLAASFPVALIFGEKSGMNPFLSGNNPEPDWKSRFPSYTVDFCEADHGQFFSKKHIGLLASLIRKRWP